MSPDQVVVVQIIATVVGSGLGTAIVGALFKHKFDKQLETQKALLRRGSKIHERQVEALGEIYFRLERALHYLQRATSAGKFKGEGGEEVQLKRMAEDLGAASETFSKSKLLISDGLIRKLDELFSGTFVAAVAVNLALDPEMPNGESRAKSWDEARAAAYKELPRILEAIRTEARGVIHG